LEQIYFDLLRRKERARAGRDSRRSNKCVTRQELIEAIRARAKDLPDDLLGQLEEQSRHHLQLLLLPAG
jgi:hypothetical protein